MGDQLRLDLQPEWTEIEKARLECQRFLDGNGVDADSTQSLAMVICELLENGLKYGAYENDAQGVRLQLELTEREATVEVINAFDAKVRPHLRRLDRRIQWIRGFQDPFEAYIERLREVARRPLEDEESGLGLVRIAYEGNAILDFVVAEDGYLNVSAVREL